LCRTYLILMEIRYMASAPFQYVWVNSGLVFDIKMFLKFRIMYRIISVNLYGLVVPTLPWPGILDLYFTT